MKNNENEKREYKKGVKKKLKIYIFRFKLWSIS